MGLLWIYGFLLLTPYGWVCLGLLFWFLVATSPEDPKSEERSLEFERMYPEFCKKCQRDLAARGRLGQVIPCLLEMFVPIEELERRALQERLKLEQDENVTDPRQVPEELPGPALQADKELLVEELLANDSLSTSTRLEIMELVRLRRESNTSS